MNKFRNNLHFSFYFNESGMGQNQEVVTDPEELKRGVEKRTTEDLNNEQQEIQEQEFPNVVGEVAYRASQKYKDNTEKLRSDRRRFLERINSKNSENKTYGEVWAKRIAERFGALITTLQEKGYFKGKNEVEERAKIKDLYKNKVYDLYEKNIWGARDKDFENIKDSIFEKGSEGEPANEVYQELTGAVIYKSNKEDFRGYHIEGEQISEAPKTTVEQRKEFLAHKLPNYLFEIKDKDAGFWSNFAHEEKITNAEKAGIENFIDLVSQLKVNKEGDIPEVALLKAFRDPEIQLDTPDYKRKEILGKYGLIVEDNLVRRVQRAGRFFLESQDSSNGVENQRTLYLTIMDLIYDYKGMDKAIAAFSNKVAAYDVRVEAESGKIRKKMARGELLTQDTEYQNFVKTLVGKGFLSDATSATRLFQRKDEDLKNVQLKELLADFNNDGGTTNADRGADKTGLQFKDILNTFPDKETAIQNLLDHAQVLNSTLALGLKNEEFEAAKKDIDSIKANKKLILLLQGIIAQPGENIHSLLGGGVDGEKKSKEYLDLLPDEETVNKAAEELVAKLSQNDIPHDPVGLRQIVAGGLYKEYAKGLGLGWEIPFDERVKGLSLNVGLQGSKEHFSMGVALSYNKTINLGKGRSITPGASIGFIGMYDFKEGKLSGGLMASAGLEIAKKWATDNGVAYKISTSGSYTWYNGLNIIGASVGFSRDKLEGIQEGAENKSLEFSEKIVGPVLKQISDELGDDSFDLRQEKVASKVRELLEAQVKKNITEREFKKLKRRDLEKSVDTAIRFLLNYNGYDLKDEKVRELISGLMAEEYAAAWDYARKNKIGGKLYRSGASVGLSWIMGTTAFNLHLGASAKRHGKDSYGDRSSREYNLNSGEKVREFNDKALDIINREFGVDESTKLKLKDGYVVIPSGYADKYVIKVNPNMKGLMKKNENGDILLHPRTPLDYVTSKNVGKKGAILYVGGKDGSGETGGEIDMRTIQNVEEWFLSSDQEIDAGSLPGLEFEYTEDAINEALEGIKKQRPDDNELKEYSRDAAEILKEIKPGLPYKIVLRKTNYDGRFSLIEKKPDIEPNPKGKGIIVEYEIRNLGRLMSDVAKKVADKVYEEARKVNNNTLRNISHGNTAWDEYKGFAQAMGASNYEEAKKQLGIMLVDRKPTMDEYIKSTNFASARDEIKNLKGAELGQALMSFNNVFARVAEVEGGTKDGSYKFVDWHGMGNTKRNVFMEKVVEERAKGIKSSIESSTELSDDLKRAYGNLIDAMEDYRHKNPDDYHIQRQKSVSLENAMGINLGNVYKVENPLFNPEIYEGSDISIRQLDSNHITVKEMCLLEQRALTIFAENQALMAPILKRLGLPENTQIKVNKPKNEYAGKLSLDIGGENVIVLSGSLRVGYFAQCVNHMLLLENIEAELNGGKVTYNAGPSIMKGRGSEASNQEVYSTTTWRAQVAVGVNVDTNSEVQSQRKDEGGEQADSHTSDSSETDKGKHQAGPGQTDDSSNIR